MLIDFRQFLYDSVEKVLFKADFFFFMTEMLRQTLAHNLNIQCRCSAQSKNRYNSRIVLRKVGILTLLRNVGILTLRNTILELLLRKVRIGTKWESHFMFFI